MLGFLGIMFIVLNQLANNQITDVLYSNDSAFNFTTDDKTEAANFMSFWNIVPLVIVVVIGLFIVRAMMVDRDQ